MSELGPEARALIDLARDADDPSPGDRQRVRRRLATAAAAATVVATAAHTAKAAGVATGSAFTATITTGKVAAVLLSGFAAGAIAAGSAALWIDERPSEPTVVVAPPAERQHPGPSSGAAPRAARGTEAAEAAIAEPESPPPAPAPRLAQPETPTLARETELLEEARAALARGDAARALALIGEHDRTFPRGAMQEEASATRILALCGLGQVTEARQAADRFLASTPRSPLRARVLASCASASVSDTGDP